MHDTYELEPASSWPVPALLPLLYLSLSLALSHFISRVLAYYCDVTKIASSRRRRSVLVYCSTRSGLSTYIYIAPKIKVYQLHNQENQAYLTIPLTQTHTHISKFWGLIASLSIFCSIFRSLK